jgi:hypothetical protein
MGEPSPPESALRLLAAFSRHAGALAWAREQAEQAWGKVALASPVFAFRETDYYQATMGSALDKVFFVFEPLLDPAELVDAKLSANDWERQYAAAAGHEEQRPLNLDPGYLTSAKLVLASTKDHAHRIYLARGIYAEVTLSYRDRCWQPHPWTFPDYRRADYQEFFTIARNYLRTRQKPLRQ